MNLFFWMSLSFCVVTAFLPDRFGIDGLTKFPYYQTCKPSKRGNYGGTACFVYSPRYQVNPTNPDPNFDQNTIIDAKVFIAHNLNKVDYTGTGAGTLVVGLFNFGVQAGSAPTIVSPFSTTAYNGGTSPNIYDPAYWNIAMNQNGQRYITTFTIASYTYKSYPTPVAAPFNGDFLVFSRVFGSTLVLTNDQKFLSTGALADTPYLSWVIDNSFHYMLPDPTQAGYILHYIREETPIGTGNYKYPASYVESYIPTGSYVLLSRPNRPKVIALEDLMAVVAIGPNVKSVGVGDIVIADMSVCLSSLVKLNANPSNSFDVLALSPYCSVMETDILGTVEDIYSSRTSNNAYAGTGHIKKATVSRSREWFPRPFPQSTTAPY